MSDSPEHDFHAPSYASAPTTTVKGDAVPLVPTAPGPVLTAEELAKQKGTEPWLFAAMRAFAQLPEGAQVSSADFDKLAAEVAGHPCGYDLK